MSRPHDETQTLRVAAFGFVAAARQNMAARLASALTCDCASLDWAEQNFKGPRFDEKDFPKKTFALAGGFDSCWRDTDGP